MKKMKKTILFTGLLVIGGLFQAHAQVVLIDNCDAVTADWSARTNVLSIDNTDFKEGKGALKSTGNHSFRFRLMRTDRMKTGTDGKSGFLAFSLFVEDVNAIEKSGQVIISSTDKSEIDAHSWPIKFGSLNNGWNEIILELTPKSARAEGSFDGNLKYFVVIQPSSKSTMFKLDNIRFAKKREDLK